MAVPSSPEAQGRSQRESPAWLQPLAAALSEALPRLLGTAPEPLVSELIGLLTAGLEMGELDVFLAGPPPAGVSAGAWPDGHRQALEASPLAASPEGPLVLEDDQLTWRRWHGRRQAVVEALLARLAWSPSATPTATSSRGARPDAAPPAVEPEADPQQCRAIAAVLEQGLVVLQGGPGTGKTSTVARMLAAVREQDPSCRIELAAPTGKAAARLRQATGGHYPCSTLHRLLESHGDHFGRHRRHPLNLDLLVIDEVSMVDLELMAAVLEALPAAARLVLVGDPAQLPPIAPGAPLLELQRSRHRQALEPALVTLTTTYRNDGAIARVAEVLRDPASHDDPLAHLRPHLRSLSAADNLHWQEAPPLMVPQPLLERLRHHQQALASLAWACDPQVPETWPPLLAERDRLLVLTPLRRGRWSVEAIHRALLGPAATGGPAGWAVGTPVLCNRNLGDLGLANGDLGVVVSSSARATAPPEPLLLFGDGGAPLWLHPAQLAGAVEPALALTVHKAQGSEAPELIVLVGGAQPDRRLLYTALTRARRQALLITAALGN